jgi:Flp pilus assembly protein TadD
MAEQMIQQQKYSNAVGMYQDILKEEPDNHKARLGLAYAHRKAGQLEQSIDIYQTLNAANPQDPVVKVEMAKIYIAQQNALEAQTILKEILTEYPKDSVGLNLMGVSYDLEGKHKQAQEYYIKAREISPKELGIQSNLGLSLALSGKYKEAIQILTKVSRNSAATPRDRQNLAIAYGLSGDLDRADQYFGTDLDPKSVKQNRAFLQSLAANSIVKSPKNQKISEEPVEAQE